jgi:hypothetical protein
MSDTTHKLTRSALNAMVAEVGTEAGPGATTKEFNRALIETFRANRGVVPGELQSANFLLLTTSVKSGAKRTTPLGLPPHWRSVADYRLHGRRAEESRLVRQPREESLGDGRAWRRDLGGAGCRARNAMPYLPRW